MPRRFFHALVALLLAGLVGCDHATKEAARATLGGGRVITLVPNLLDLRYAENRGTAFSVLDHAHGPLGMAALVVASLVALAAVGVYAWKIRNGGGARLVACALIVAGAIGNVVDRITRGYVVDFVHLHHWPVFNVADVAITVGIALLLLASLRRSRAAPA